MALYWPEAKVALDIIDDPDRNPFMGGDDYTVLRVTCAELENYESYLHVMEQLCKLLGQSEPPVPKDEPDESLKSVEILASSKDEAELMRRAAKAAGRKVRGTSIWNGPVPPDSFEDMGNGLRMSTPEFMFLRKANELPFGQAVRLGNELCGRFRTSLTQFDAQDDEYDYLCQPRTTKERIRSYLRGARDTKEYKRARKVLRVVADGASSPIASHIHELLCLPRSRGGYGLPPADCACAFESPEGLAPAPEGPYLAYDLAWGEELVAVQYSGERPPTKRQLEALQANGMRVVCVTNRDVEDPQRFDKVVRKVANLLKRPLPDDDERWSRARERLREQVSAPAFDHMRTTLADLSEHCC